MDHSGNRVYRTKVELEDMRNSRNLMMITYRSDVTHNTVQSILYPLVTQLRVTRKFPAKPALIQQFSTDTSAPVPPMVLSAV